MRLNRSTLRRTVTLASLLSVVGATMAVSAQNRVHLDKRLVNVLEQRFGRADIRDWSRVTGLVVAGGAPTRVAEALRLARMHAHLKIVLTGPGEDEVAAALKAEGVARERVIIEPLAVNTYENAVRSKSLIAPKPGETWLLVTSAAHMPRAIGSFYGAAFFVEPWPVVDKPHDAHGLAQVAQHEWLGLVAYWLRGRTISLFPGQEHLKAARQRG